MSGPPKAWLMLSIECGFGARGASLSVRGAGATAAALAAPSTTSSSGVGRLRKRGRPVSSFCIQFTNAVHDQTWKSQSFGFGGPGMLPPGKTGARSVDSHQPGKTLQALAVPVG